MKMTMHTFTVRGRRPVMLRASLILAAVAVLSACASGPVGLRMTDLRDPIYFRGDRVLPGDFPQLQMALFKHEQTCGHAPQFSLDKNQTSYATIVEMPEPSSTYERAVLIDLVQYKPNYLAENRMKAKAYSYYADAATLGRIDQVYQAILHPEVCPKAKAG